MSGIAKKIGKIFKKRDALAPIPGAGQTSRQATGIASGRRAAAKTEEPIVNRRPGRRATDTPLGPGRQRL
jgi:hypothetical protein